MHHHLLTSLVTAALLCCTAAPAAQTAMATLSGRVYDGQGLAVPNVVITAHSPQLQGARVTKTTGNGDYQLALLPPGSYVFTFDAPQFAEERVVRDIAAAADVRVDVTLRPAPVQQQVEVTRSRGIFAGSVPSAANISAATLHCCQPTAR